MDSEEEFKPLLTDFLFSTAGSVFKPNFQFSEELKCDFPSPDILVRYFYHLLLITFVLYLLQASKFEFEYLAFEGPDEHIPAKDTVDEIIRDSRLSEAFSFNKIYAAWETDRIIGWEMWRNIVLALVCVFVITLLLLANLPICLLVLFIVTITVVDVVGFLHFWDITIDIISCINIVLAIGLCVDYSAHVGHAFLVATGIWGK